MVTNQRRRTLTVAGSVNLDLVAPVPQIPAPGQTVLGGALQRHPGGKGANQAVAAARLGAAVHFFGAVGDDTFGAELARGLADEGVEISGLVRVPGASGCALINVAASGENAISVLPGANRHAPLPPPDWRAGQGDVLLLQLEVPVATTLAWAEAGRRAGATVILNAAPFAPLPAALLRASTILVVNEGEMASLARQAQDDAVLATALQALAWRVVTRGAAGVRAFAHDGRVLEHAALAVAVVDSTGAGDTFCGALAAGLAESPAGLAGSPAGLTFDTALARANHAAALACTAVGARAGMPGPSDLKL